MSRSYKNFGIIRYKETSRPIYNRRFRRINNQRVWEEKEPLKMREYINSYEICDCEIYWSGNENHLKQPNLPAKPFDKESVRLLNKTRPKYFGK